MSLRLLVDEDTQDKGLIGLLGQAGHDVRSVNEAGLRTQADPFVFAYACQERRLILTHNVNDFQNLHEEQNDHPGVLAIYRDDDRRKDMEPEEVVRAIANLEASGWELAGQFVVLNAWNFESPPPPVEE